MTTKHIVLILLCLMLLPSVAFFGKFMYYGMSLQQVDELDKKCLQQQGETLLAVNKQGYVKYVQCKKQGAVYDKF